jgi:hypothetical protein
MSGAAGIPTVHGGEEVNATVMSSLGCPRWTPTCWRRDQARTHGCSGPPEPSSTLPAWAVPVWKRPVRADCGKLSAVGAGEDEEAK